MKDSGKATINFLFTASAARGCVPGQHLIRTELVSSGQGLEEELMKRGWVLTPSSKGRAAGTGFAHFL